MCGQRAQKLDGTASSERQVWHSEMLSKTYPPKLQILWSLPALKSIFGQQHFLCMSNGEQTFKRKGH